MLGAAVSIAGYGDIGPKTVAEKILTMVVFVMGAALYATIFGTDVPLCAFISTEPC